MALTNFQKQLLVKYLGDIYASGGSPKRDAIARAMAKYTISPTDIAQVKYQYTIAQRTVEAAGIARRTHNRTPLPSEIPPVPGERSRAGMYRTEILTTYTDPVTGIKSSTRQYIYSADPMSLDRVRLNVEANRQNYINQIRKSDKSSTITDDGDLRTILLNIGRVYISD